MKNLNLEFFKKITYCHFLTDWASNDFFYPPVFIWPKFNEDIALENYLKTVGKNLSTPKYYIDLYFHFPLCRYKCYFCRQFSIACRKHIFYEKYLNLLIKEIRMWIHKMNLPSGRLAPDSIYLGGGTPTEFNLEKFFFEIKKFINFKKIKQIDIESTLEPLKNPLKFSFLKELKPNQRVRLTIGIQSFDQKVLKAINRYPFQKRIFGKVFRNIKSWNLGEVAFDLLAGLPKQSTESFLNDVQFLVQQKANLLHLNYFLNTPLTIWGSKHKTQIENKQEALKALQIAEKFLQENNYKKTSYGSWRLKSQPQNLNVQIISPPFALRKNFFKKNFAICVGPSGKGRLPDYHGQHEVQILNTCDLRKYEEKIENNQLPIEKIYKMNNSENKRRAVIRSLRYSLIDKDLYKKVFGRNFELDFPKEINFLKKTLGDKLKISDSLVTFEHFAGTLILGKIFYSPEVLKKCTELIKKRYKNCNFDLNFIPYIEDFNKIIVNL